MIRVISNCENCVHKKVCRNKDNPKRLYDRLCNTIFETSICDDPSNNHTWDQATGMYNVNIELSCPDFTNFNRLDRLHP